MFTIEFNEETMLRTRYCLTMLNNIDELYNNIMINKSFFSVSLIYIPYRS